MSAPVNTATTPGARARGAHVDRCDVCVCERAAQEHGLQYVVGRDVGDVAAVAGEQSVVLDPLDALSDEAGPVGAGGLLGDGHDASPFVSVLMISTARSTPATIDW